jgi:hypothetical protein
LTHTGDVHDFSDIIESALDGSGTGIWDRNVATGEIRYSPGWKAILGYNKTDLGNRIEESFTRVPLTTSPMSKRPFKPISTSLPTGMS